MIISTVALVTIGIYTIPRGLHLLGWLSWLVYLPETLFIVLCLLPVTWGGTLCSLDSWLVTRREKGRTIIFVND